MCFPHKKQGHKEDEWAVIPLPQTLCLPRSVTTFPPPTPEGEALPAPTHRRRLTAEAPEAEITKLRTGTATATSPGHSLATLPAHITGPRCRDTSPGHTARTHHQAMASPCHWAMLLAHITGPWPGHNAATEVPWEGVLAMGRDGECVCKAEGASSMDSLRNSSQSGKLTSLSQD